MGGIAGKKKMGQGNSLLAVINSKLWKETNTAIIITQTIL